MTRLRSQLDWIGRLALGLLLALALVPSISRAMADANAVGPWAELCSSLGSGTRMLLADGPSDDGSAPAAALQQGEHCPLCSHAPPALPAPAVAGLPPVDGSTGHPPLFGQAPRPLFAWLAAAPRGPPSLA